MTHTAKPGSEKNDLDPQEPIAAEELKETDGMDESAENIESEGSAEIRQEPEEQPSVESLQAALQSAEAALKKEQEKALRVAAEAENTKRRALLDVEKATNFALEKFATELLEVIDNLERTIQAIDPENESTQAIGEGVKITYKGFLNTVRKFGLEPIEPEGETFNPQFHQAMSMQESTEVAPNTVLHVLAKGYVLNGRLLRPAMVMVSRAPTEGVDTQA